MNIAEEIGLPAMYEQLAEECSELAHAALKLARQMRGENPTPKTSEECFDDLLEEVADVQLLLLILPDVDLMDVTTRMETKRKRWEQRIRNGEGRR